MHANGLFQVSIYQMHHLRGHPRHADLDPHLHAVAAIIEAVGRQIAPRERLQQARQQAGIGLRGDSEAHSSELAQKGPWLQ